MDLVEFQTLVERTLAGLPDEVLGALRNVAFLVETQSPDGELLGEYVGVPRINRGSDEPMALPDRIILYFDDIAEECDHDATRIAQEVERTLWHEIAHHLGWEEDELEEAEETKGWHSPSFE